MPRYDVFPESNPTWYKDAVIYQIHIKAFRDGDGDGMGDFRGLIQKLDYLENLGVTALWLLPFYPSPLRDDGYDIADYFSVHEDYGTLADFRALLREAHKRGLRVVTELVLNHTSDQHAWFRRALEAPAGSAERNFYVWNETPDKYPEARIIFGDFEASNWTWSQKAGAYYWHRFYYHQPDLNYDNPAVRRAMFKVLDFWFGMGVDGLRLDAVPYLYEREGTNCENLPETYAYLRQLRSHIDRKFRDRMLLAEANQWPEDAVAYLGDGLMCHMAFHFPLMPRMYIALQMEDRFPIIDIMDQTPSISDTNQWAIFLRNHDELTLEMVTDEERDYMYRVYARDVRARINLGIRRRLAPLLGGDRRKIELLNILLFSMPGTPVIYYGDEIGMGDNYYLGDRNGVRTPMQWSSDKNAGFSEANPQQLYLPVIIDPEYHYETVNVANQDRNLASLLWWMKRVIAIRKTQPAFGRGDLQFLYPTNPKILAFVRRYEDRDVLVAVNLSKFSQATELDLTDYAGYVPVEIFSGNRFPGLGRDPYPITFAGYGYYWFLLEKEEAPYGAGEQTGIPELVTAGTWRQFPDAVDTKKLEKAVLPSYLRRSRWFGEKALTIQKVELREQISLDVRRKEMKLFLVQVSFTEGSGTTYLVPLSLASEERADVLMNAAPQSIIFHLTGKGFRGFVFDAVHDDNFARILLSMIAGRRRLSGMHGDLIASPSPEFRSLLGEEGLDLPSRVLKVEQSNSSILFGNRLFLKLYRKLDEGINSEIEIVRFLTDSAGFSHIPPFAGSLEYRRGDSVYALGVAQGFVQNEGDAWRYVLNMVGEYFNRIFETQPDIGQFGPLPPSIPEVNLEETHELFRDLAGEFFIEMMQLLGKRTGEMHLALASSRTNPDFAPESFSTLYQRSLYQSMRSLTRRALLFLAKKIDTLPEELRPAAEDILGSENEILARQNEILKRRIRSRKIRNHGDYHLGQVLFTGKDFVIIDFEGEPARAMSERRLKRSPIRDVAGMIRSFHYAVQSAYKQYVASRPEDAPRLSPWTRPWYIFISGLFFAAYCDTVRGAQILPEESENVGVLLDAYVLDKAVYELMYELNNRPDWVDIPMEGIRQILNRSVQVV